VLRAPNVFRVCSFLLPLDPSQLNVLRQKDQVFFGMKADEVSPTNWSDVLVLALSLIVVFRSGPPLCTR
jgi:hypothetical protein